MATQLDQIQADIREIKLHLRQHTRQLTALAAGENTTMITVTALAAQLDAATTAEAQALATVRAKIDAQSASIDAAKNELQSLFDRMVSGGATATDLSSLSASIAKISGSASSLSDASIALDAQAARLTELARDTSNPVPTAAPPAS